jgi:hypothetical protein
MSIYDDVSTWYKQHLLETQGGEVSGKWSAELFIAKTSVLAFIDVQLAGDIKNIYTADSHLKQRYNKLQEVVFRLEQEAQDCWHKQGLPSLEEVNPEAERKYRELDFIKSERSKFTEAVMGWYQNSDGDLFHYDGVIWDKIPKEAIQELEFLG